MSQVASPRSVVGAVDLAYYRAGFAALFPIQRGDAFEDLLLAIDRAEARQGGAASPPEPGTAT